MNFTRPWTAFALDAEYDHYGATRIVKAHNAERERREAAEALLADAVNGALAFSSHGVVKGILNHFARHEKD